jgi:DNA-binding CsgD family transcriptional regulator
MIENQIVRQLHGIAGKLTADLDLQKNLMQEMFVHLVRVQTAEAGQPLSWYLKSCEFHARNYLKVGGNGESLTRARNGVPYEDFPAAINGEARGNGVAHSPMDVAIEIQGELITNEIVNRLVPRLSDMQQQILFLLMKGCGVRETGREVGITHPAVIKHRKKIARIAHELLQESADASAAVPRHNGTNGNGNGEAQSH